MNKLSGNIQVKGSKFRVNFQSDILVTEIFFEKHVELQYEK